MLKFFLVFLFVLITAKGFSQDVSSEIYDPPIPYNSNVDWGNDYLVSNTEPLGRPSGVYRTTNSTIYVAIPDTNVVANKSLVILISTNNGVNWSVLASVSPANIVPKTKMICRPGGDSVYCFFIIGSTLYSWNVITNNLNQFTAYTNICDFDATMSSTNSLYVYIDLNTNNDTRIYGSSNGGVLWPNSIYISSASARPRVTMSGLGDTAILNYFASPAGDTISGAIRNVRYRESAPGTLLIVGSFTSPVVAGAPKNQFEAVRNGSHAWLFYTSGSPGIIDLNFMYSSDGGTTYGPALTIGALAGRDEIWFDAKYYNGGVDIIYYSDTTAPGIDRLYNTFATNSNPTVFSTPVTFSEHEPVTSVRNYIPTLIEFNDVNADAGALWVGLDGANRKVYFDRYGALTGVSHNGTEIPSGYSLSQNYPNPFNPATKIDFAVPVKGLVTLKIFDVLGREVEILLNREFLAGNYTVDYDASKLTSGIYFYTISAGNFTETKKMILIK